MAEPQYLVFDIRDYWRLRNHPGELPASVVAYIPAKAFSLIEYTMLLKPERPVLMPGNGQVEEYLPKGTRLRLCPEYGFAYRHDIDASIPLNDIFAWMPTIKAVEEAIRTTFFEDPSVII